MAELPRGTVTFLFTDIEGSTALWERFPEATQVAIGRHDAILRELVERHGGRVVATVRWLFARVRSIPSGHHDRLEWTAHIDVWTASPGRWSGASLGTIPARRCHRVGCSVRVVLPLRSCPASPRDGPLPRLCRPAPSPPGCHTRTRPHLGHGTRATPRLSIDSTGVVGRSTLPRTSPSGVRQARQRQIVA
jgi:hypothetical protein